MTSAVLSHDFRKESLSLFTAFMQLLGASLFIAVVAQIQIPLPFTPVPITLQTLGIMLVGGMLGPRKGAIAALFYLAEAAAGLPVLAGGISNPFWILFPSAGYLVGMVPLAAVTGWLYERKESLGSFTHFLLLGTATFAHLAFGAAWLAKFFVGWDSALLMGFYPFLPGDLIKLIALSYCLDRTLKCRTS